VLYGIGFVGNIGVPKSIDSGPPSALATALPIDVALVAVFGIQHSLMARARFKRVFTRFVPPLLERSSFVLAASFALGLLFWQWRTVPDAVWNVAGPELRKAMWLLYFGGWGVVTLSSFMIDHFDLFGIRQSYLFLRDRPYAPVPFRVRGFYRIVRHPLLVGFLVAFWATSHMSVGHLIFTLSMTAYIAIGVVLEERGLVAELGDEYRRYRERVRMLVPLPKMRASAAETAQKGVERQSTS
jgi:protein-S-isoprenylcysteine O-methyltransferase Ste14